MDFFIQIYSTIILIIFTFITVASGCLCFLISLCMPCVCIISLCVFACISKFDTVNHNILLSKIARSTLPEATCRWLSNYIRGRQSVTSCRVLKSKATIIHIGVPQGSKLSPTLFSFYIADMLRPTEPVRQICYADDITVWGSRVKNLGTGAKR